MKNYHFNFDKENISNEEIKNAMNFNKLSGKYSINKSKHNNTKWFKKALLPIALVAMVTFIVLNPFIQGKNSDFIKPPIKGVNIAFEKTSFDAERGGVIKFESRTTIAIPENAFRDENGKNINGLVDISYREFTNTLDVFLAGIPMNYDTNGQNFRFESAGMLEIKGSKDGKTIYLKDGKEISVNMLSSNNNPDFNVYYLDTNQRRWIYEGRDTVVAPQFTYDVNTDSNEIIDFSAIDIKQPTKPRKADNSKFHLSIDFLDEQFPELRGFRNIVFEVSESNKNFNPKWRNQLWNDIKIERDKKVGEYVIIFTSPTQQIKVNAYPVIPAENYAQALKEFEIRFDEYEKQLAQKIEEQKIKVEEDKIKAIEAKNKLLAQAMTATVGRNFNINRMGIWNIDLKQSYPVAVTVKASFTDKNGNELKINQVNLGIKNKNIYYTFTKKQFDEFTYDPSLNNILWAVTSDMRLAVLSYEDFKRVKPNQGKCTFKMKVSPQPLLSASDIQNFLNI